MFNTIVLEKALDRAQELADQHDTTVLVFANEYGFDYRHPIGVAYDVISQAGAQEVYGDAQPLCTITPRQAIPEDRCACVTLDIPGHDQGCPACTPHESGDGQSDDDYMTARDHGL